MTNTQMHRPISFIGAGNMSKSIISGLIQAGYPAHLIMASNRSTEKLDALQQSFNIKTTLSNDEAVTFGDAVVLAVKPQMMKEVCGALSEHGKHTNKLFISIAAGITVERLTDMIGNSVPMVRVMPNTPSLIGKGMSGLFANETVTESDKDYVTQLMQAVGDVAWVKKEADINGVIAAAGSSPAYFFLFLEAMQNEAMSQGFDKDTARKLVQQAMLGAAEMVCHNPNLELSELRAQVTSKGGTTAQAINSFMENGLESLVQNAMRAAITRAQEMERTF